VIGDECVDLVRDILEAVHHLFKMIVEFCPDDEVHRIARVSFPIGKEQRLAALIVELVCLLLDANDLLSQAVETADVLAD
jgi:hypothetical protein